MFVIEESTIPVFTTAETREIPVSIDILASANVAQVQRNDARLLIDDVEIGIVSYRYDKDRSFAGTTCNFTLADFDNHTLLTSEAVIKFQTSTDGGSTWKTRADNQKVRSKSFGIDRERQVCSFSTIDGAAARLNKAPAETLVMYDPAASPFDPAEVETRYDTAGTEYGVESISVPDMTLEDVLDEIIVTRCGFTSYWTNLPKDIPVKQASFDLAIPYWEGIKPLIGAYAPIPEIIGDTFYLYDPNLALGTDAPVPRDLTVFGCSGLAVNTQETQADCVRLSYTGAAWDYIENLPRVDTETEEDGDDLLSTNVIQNYWLYKSRLFPNVVQKKELQAELRDTYRQPGVIHEKLQTVSHLFDKYGRKIKTTTRTGERVPDLANPGDFVFTEETREEIEETEYAQHPHDARRQYEKSYTHTVNGLKVVDTANPYDWDKVADSASFDFREAHIGRSLTSDFEYVSGLQLLNRQTETFAPKKGGLVDYARHQYHAVAGMYVDRKNSPRTGDVGLNGQFGTPQELFVLETEESTKGVGTFIDLAVGDLPLKYAIPLARRILYKAKYAPANADLTIIGIDDAVSKGAVFTAKDKNGVSLGVFIAEGYSGQGGVQGYENGRAVFSHTMTVQGSQIPTDVPDAVITSYSLTVGSASAITITRDIECFDGYELTSDTVSDLTVEARISGAWTNIETGAIDLSPYDGTTQTFEIRLTAAVTAVNLHKDFSLWVQNA